MIKDFFLYIGAILIVFLLLLYIFAKRQYEYWKIRGVDYLEPTFPFGNMSEVVQRKRHLTEQLKEIYTELKAKNKTHGGMYILFTPIYIAINPNVIKHILIKDFNNFVNRGVLINPKIDPLSNNIGFMEENEWRTIRSKLSPCFNSGKIKQMFNIVNKCAIELNETIGKYSNKSQSFDIGDLVSRYTVDVIGTSAYGLECNSLLDPETIFRKMGQQMFPNSTIDFIILLASICFPKWLYKLLRIKFVDSDVEKFFVDLVAQTVEYRVKNNVKRNDLMESFIQIWFGDDDFNEINNDDKRKKIYEIAAQTIIFFSAGFETSSTGLMFAFYELAKNMEIQDKLRIEIKSVLTRHNNQITYESINEMDYLDMVVLEVLRKYPHGFLIRESLADYDVPTTDFRLEKGTKVMIPLLGLHKDPEFYPDPEMFDPMRFTEENKKSRPPCTFLSYGDGPRSCIAFKFGALQMKLCIVSLLRDYEFRIDRKTIEPLKLIESKFFAIPEGGVWLQAKKIP